VIGVQAIALHRESLRVSATYIAPFLVLLTVVAIGFAALDVPSTSFRSPDEHANFIFTKTFASTGRLSYEEDYLERDAENLLHPRGVLTHEGKGVPFNYLGTPVFYAPFYHLLGENIRYVGIAFAVIAVTAMAGAGSLLVPKRPWLAWICVLGATPILYYINRPFLNSLPCLAFFSVGVFFLLYYLQRQPGGRWGWLCLASFWFALAALARYESAVFSTLLMMLVLAYEHRPDWLRAAKHVVPHVAILAVVFVIPVLILNQLTYGSLSTFGYGLFNEAYFPDRATGASWPSDVLRMGRALMLPSYPVDITLAFKALTRQVFGVAPVFCALAAFGLFIIIRDRVLPLRWVVAGLLLATYVFLYRGAGYSWLADAPEGNLEASVVRYSLPLYLGFYLVAVFALSRVQQASVAGLIALIVAFVGVTAVLHDVDGSLMHVRTQVRAGDELTREDVLPNVERGAIVYTDVFDKTIGPYRDVAAWWGGVRGTHEGFFQPRAVARSIARASEDNQVYLYLYEYEYVIPRVRQQLADWDLTIVPWRVERLYRVAPVPSATRS
jgi:hypothetical protein